MKAAIVNCPWWVRYCPPYLLAYFATFLRARGHEVCCLDLNNAFYHAADPALRRYWDDRDYYSFWENPAFTGAVLAAVEADRWVDRILESGARVVLFPVHTTSVLISLELARRIKQRCPDRVIVFFGHKAARAQMAFDLIREPQVDYVCPGEADLALLELFGLLETHAGAGERPSCRGFLSKRGGDVSDGGDPETVADLDTLPFPDYADFREDILEGRYVRPDRLDLLDSRGCVNDCRFCYERLFWPGYRSMSGRRLFEQARYHTAQFPGVRFFYFNGLLLNGDLRHLEEFCDLVLAHALPVRWAGQAAVRPDMTAALLAKMRRAGCEWLGYGVESGSRRVLEAMHKRCSPDDILRVLRDTHEAGIGVQANFMFGFPTETEEDFRETLSLLRAARPFIDSVLASQSFCTLEKDTFVRLHPEAFGITGDPHHLYWVADGGRNTYEERFRRYEEFCGLALSLGLPETSGVLRVKPDKWFLLGQYFRHARRFDRAAACFRRSLETESRNETTFGLLKACLREIDHHESGHNLS